MSFKNQAYTRKGTLQKYLNLHAGPEFQIHNRYSAILVIVFVCMLYGTGIPILYPIAFISLFIRYIMDRVLLTYYNQKPPQYDDDLAKETNKLLPWAGIIHLLVGFWMMGNPLMFTNNTVPFNSSNDVRSTGHDLNSIFKLNHSTMYFILGCFAFILYLFRHFFTKILKKLGIVHKAHEEDLEDLLPYFEVMPKFYTTWWIKEEEFVRNKLVI